MSEATGKVKVKPSRAVESDDWNSRFVFDSGHIGTKSLPFITSKPYIAQNGSEVKSVLKTKAKDIKRRKNRRDKEQPVNLDIIASPIISTNKKLTKRPLQKEKKISLLQQGKIKSLRNRARPFSLPMLRDVQSPLHLGTEKSYSARDSSSRASLLKIDVSLNMETSKELKQWQDFKEITEDCDSNDRRHLTRLYCVGRSFFSNLVVFKHINCVSLLF